jgi:hypothetical protein
MKAAKAMVSESKIISKVTRFYYTNQKVEPAEERSRLVDEFLREGLLVEEGNGPNRLGNIKMRHPVTYRKSLSKQYSVLEILAEFIIKPMRNGATGEKRREYPINGAYRELKAKQWRLKHETPILLNSEEGKGILDSELVRK